MEASILTSVLLPLALFIIMLGMGLSLVIDDFRRVAQYPKAATIGLINQLLFLPLIGFAIASVSGLPGELCVGLMILAACPGGVTSNLISHLAKGDTALSISLTAISSVVSILTIPLIINFAIEHFLHADQAIKPPTEDIVKQIIAITILPVSIGMLIRKKRERFALRMDKPVRIFSAVFLLLIIVAAIIKEKQVLIDYFGQVWIATLGLNITTMLLGYAAARIFKLTLPQSVTISIESGIQNGTLGLVIATTILQNSLMSITPAIYSLLMFGTGALMVFYFGRRKEESAVS
ncbi:MAG TPA: bile acid:sodium symporter family protein [Flavobacteriales bacterium]|jgi:BASS family bile acid:Na+ symporter|nr:bile acid:sodium symporter family protein [Flavobacteriales bacterium]HIA12730.1 bile acid:sodium symporter family protein [Flavobacteriales bacterium]HIO73066.1 bile acid:sodium symporter family protein [Flavobacteriales bacterium]